MLKAFAFIAASSVAFLPNAGWGNTHSSNDTSTISNIRPGNATEHYSSDTSLRRDVEAWLRQGDFDIAIPSLRSLAETGDTWAMRELGWLFANGKGVAYSPAAAIDWFTKAANRGDHRSMLLLGTAYARGIGVKEDVTMARRWLRMASESNERDVASPAIDELRRLR